MKHNDICMKRALQFQVLIKVEYPTDFTEQMLEYAKTYSFLPSDN